MALLSSSLRHVAFLVLLVALITASCSDPAPEDTTNDDINVLELEDPPRRYSAEWLIDTNAIGLEGVASPFVYRESSTTWPACTLSNRQTTLRCNDQTRWSCVRRYRGCP